MNWFQGDVVEAIKSSKSTNSPLIVFLAGKDAISQLYLDTLNKLPDFEEKLYVAMRIDADSVAHGQLSAIYGAIGVPSVLVIDAESGAAKERFSGPSFSAEKLLCLLPNNSKPTTMIEKMGSEEASTEQISAPIDIVPKQKNDSVSQPEKNEVPRMNFGSYNFQPSTCSIEKYTNAKIQLKLHGKQGEIVTINAEETLATVKIKASELFELRSPFNLAIPYPRRVFLSEEYLLSVETLGLCPSATLLVLPTANTSQLSTTQFTTTFFTYLEPFLAFLRNIWERLYGRAREPNAPNSRIVRIKND